jgi:hypothetical protein
MRELALLGLNREFRANGLAMSRLREKALAPFLVEASEKISKVYLLQANPNRPGVVILIRMWVEWRN